MPAGTIYTASQAKKELLESNRNYNNRLTWQNAVTGVNAQAMEAQSKLNQQYINASTDAYVQYLQNKNALEGSNVVGVGREQLLQQTELALQDAYNSYAQSLQSGRADISASQQEQLTNIEDALEQQAQYTADYTNAHIAYLKELWSRYENDENTLFDDPNWAKYKRYIVPMTDENGNPLTDENGNVIYDETQPSLLTDDEINALLYDEQGLTFSGVDFFDQLENEIANYDTGYTWSDYLQETNPELYDWAKSYNPYNYTSEGSNAGTMRTMYGMLSDDYTYQFSERFGGVTYDMIQDSYDDLLKSTDNLFSGNLDSTNQEIDKMAEDIMSLADTYGLTSELKAAGINVDTVKSALSGEKDKVLDTLNKNAGEDFLWFMVTPLGIGGLISMGVNESENNEALKNYQAQARTMYRKLIQNMSMHSASKRRQSEIDFNRRTGRT